MNTLAPSFLIGFFSFLQVHVHVTLTTIKPLTSSKFDLRKCPYSGLNLTFGFSLHSFEQNTS